MPPKKQIGSSVGRPAPQRGGYAQQVYNEITSTENRSVVTSLAFFAAGVAFLHSNWSDLLLPPYALTRYSDELRIADLVLQNLKHYMQRNQCAGVPSYHKMEIEEPLYDIEESIPA